MDSIHLALAVVAALSEILPLLGFTRANGVLHGIHSLIIHIHAESDCHARVDLDVDSATQTPGAAEGPAATAAFAAAPP
jgi:membrane protein required for beta-lactamase induction